MPDVKINVDGLETRCVHCGHSLVVEVGKPFPNANGFDTKAVTVPLEGITFDMRSSGGGGWYKKDTILSSIVIVNGGGDVIGNARYGGGGTIR